MWSVNGHLLHLPPECSRQDAADERKHGLHFCCWCLSFLLLLLLLSITSTTFQHFLFVGGSNNFFLERGAKHIFLGGIHIFFGGGGPFLFIF